MHKYAIKASNNVVSFISYDEQNKVVLYKLITEETWLATFIDKDSATLYIKEVGMIDVSKWRSALLDYFTNIPVAVQFGDVVVEEGE